MLQQAIAAEVCRQGCPVHTIMVSFRHVKLHLSEFWDYMTYLTWYTRLHCAASRSIIPFNEACTCPKCSCNVWDYKKAQRMRHCTCEQRTPDCFWLCKRPLSCIARLQEAVSSKPFHHQSLTVSPKCKHAGDIGNGQAVSIWWSQRQFASQSSREGMYLVLCSA